MRASVVFRRQKEEGGKKHKGRKGSKEEGGGEDDGLSVAILSLPLTFLCPLS